MLDLKNLNAALDQLAQDKGISKEKIIETIEMALAAAYKKDYGKKTQIVRSKFDASTGGAAFWQVKTVVDESMIKSEEEMGESLAEGEVKKVRFNPDRHIMIDEAKALKKGVKLGEELTFPLETKEDYGRIAAQTAKQVILQRIREAERDSIYDEFSGKEGEIVSGIVQRVE